MTKQERKEKFGKIRPYIGFVITGLVGLFTNAISDAVLGQVEGNRVSKFGAKLGGGLVSFMIGEQVSDYICDGIDDFMDNMDDLKETIETAKEEE